jgi:hypothetical protein
VRTQVGNGTFVADAAAAGDGRASEREVDRILDRAIVESSALGYSLERLASRLAKRVDAFERDRRRAASGGRSRPGGER